MNSNEENYKKAAKYYDACFSYRKDTSFYVEMVKRQGGSVLDLGCGTGRVTFAIAEFAEFVIGLDVSQPRLDIANAKLQTIDTPMKERITFLFGDMSDFSLDKKFDLIIIPFRGFQHILTTKQQKAVFQCIGRHLKKRGKLVFDIFNPSIPFLASDSMFEEFEERKELILDSGELVSISGKITDRNYFNQTLAAQEIYYIKSTNGKERKIVLKFNSRYTFCFELINLLELCDFKVLNIWGSFDFQEFGNSNYPGEIIIEASKASWKV